MEFIGAAEYWFWEGVESGFIGYDLISAFYMDNKTTKACTEAWLDGHAIGECLDAKDYEDLCSIPEVQTATVTKVDKKKKTITIKNNTPVIGNC